MVSSGSSRSRSRSPRREGSPDSGGRGRREAVQKTRFDRRDSDGSDEGKRKRRSSDRDDREDGRRKTSRGSRSPDERRASRKKYSRSRSRSRSRSGSPNGFNETEGYRLHVADLESRADKRDLEKVFGKYGPLKEIWMARSVPCFAFIVFRYREDAEDAQRRADGEEICGRRIRVTVAKPRTKSRSGGGRDRRSFDPNVKCYQCGDKGHFSRDCPNSRFGSRRSSPGRRRSHR